MQPYRLGRHLTVDFYDCSLQKVRDPSRVEAAMRAAAQAGRATVMGCQMHEYLPQGVSGVLVIAESHITVHTWPEHRFAAADIFTCGDTMDLAAAVDAFATALEAQRTEVTGDFARGGKLHDVEALPPMAWAEALEAGDAAALAVGVDLEACERATPEAAQLMVQHVAGVLAAGGVDAQTRRWMDRVHGAALEAELRVGTVRVAAVVFPDAHRARLDVTSDRFVEPRELAERAVGTFGARNYELSVALRG